MGSGAGHTPSCGPHPPAVTPALGFKLSINVDVTLPPLPSPDLDKLLFVSLESKVLFRSIYFTAPLIAGLHLYKNETHYAPCNVLRLSRAVCLPIGVLSV